MLRYKAIKQELDKYTKASNTTLNMNYGFIIVKVKYPCFMTDSLLFVLPQFNYKYNGETMVTIVRPWYDWNEKYAFHTVKPWLIFIREVSILLEKATTLPAPKKIKSGKGESNNPNILREQTFKAMFCGQTMWFCGFNNDIFLYPTPQYPPEQN